MYKQHFRFLERRLIAWGEKQSIYFRQRANLWILRGWPWGDRGVGSRTMVVERYHSLPQSDIRSPCEHVLRNPRLRQGVSDGVPDGMHACGQVLNGQAPTSSDKLCPRSDEGFHTGWWRAEQVFLANSRAPEGRAYLTGDWRVAEPCLGPGSLIQ